MGNLLLLNTGGFAPIEFSPLDLGNLLLWVEADYGITLNGSNVSQWADKSGNNNHLLQATAANQPTYATNQINGLPAITFDGTNDFLNLTSNIHISTGDRTNVAIYKRNSTANQGIFTATSNDYAYLQIGALWFSGYNQYISGSTMTTGSWYVRTTAVTTNVSTDYYSNGANIGSSGANPDEFIYTIGSDLGSNGYLNGQLYGLLVFGKKLSGAEMTLLNNYINGKVAIF